MFETFTLLIVAGTFLIAGTVKGVIGLGLPTVSLALLTVAVGLPEAMALMLMPSFITNVWQSMVGGNGTVILRRLWPFLLTAALMVGAGSVALTQLDLHWLSALLGGLLITYAAVSLAGYRFEIAVGQEVWIGPLAGSVNGILTGMTGSFVVPGVMYLQAIGLPRDMLIQAMGMLFTVSTLALAIALQDNGFLTVELGSLSMAALLPAIIGMVIGQRFRRRLPELLFRRVFFIALLLLGVYIIASALGSQ